MVKEIYAGPNECTSTDWPLSCTKTDPPIKLVCSSITCTMHLSKIKGQAIKLKGDNPFLICEHLG